MRVLLVEDNPGDARLTVEALRDAAFPIDLAISRDGDDATARLRRQGDHASAPRPDLILLDLNLPKKDGREILAETKMDNDLGTIAIAVLTSSQSDEDVAKCYELGANAYVFKPVDLDDYFSVTRSVVEFFRIVLSSPIGPEAFLGQIERHLPAEPSQVGGAS